MIKTVCVAAISLLVSLSSNRASATNNTDMVSLNGLMPYAVPLQPLQGGQWTAQLAPAYVMTKNTNSNGGVSSDLVRLSGPGGAAGINYTFNSHVALGLLGIDFSEKGTDTLTGYAGLPDGTKINSTTSGYAISAIAILDPFSGDGFRLPFVFGVNTIKAQSSYDYPIEHGGCSNGLGCAQGSETKNVNSPGFTFGLSPQFNTGRWLRWEPFVMMMQISKATVCNGVGCGTDNGQTQEKTDPGAAVGVNIVLRPYNLSLFIAPSVGDKSGSSVYALRWVKSFGGNTSTNTEEGAGVTK